MMQIPETNVASNVATNVATKLASEFVTNWATEPQLPKVEDIRGAYQFLGTQRYFIDTNILVYADSADEPVKQRAALNILRHIRQANRGVLSTQVLTEYCNVALKKLGMPHADVRQQLRFWQQFEVVQVTASLVHEALDIQQTRGISYFDALIVAAAQISGCHILLSEDMHHSGSINGVKIVNPFAN